MRRFLAAGLVVSAFFSSTAWGELTSSNDTSGQIPESNATTYQGPALTFEDIERINAKAMEEESKQAPVADPAVSEPQPVPAQVAAEAEPPSAPAPQPAPPQVAAAPPAPAPQPAAPAGTPPPPAMLPGVGGQNAVPVIPAAPANTIEVAPMPQSFPTLTPNQIAQQYAGDISLYGLFGYTGTLFNNDTLVAIVKAMDHIWVDGMRASWFDPNTNDYKDHMKLFTALGIDKPEQYTFTALLAKIKESNKEHKLDKEVIEFLMAVLTEPSVIFGNDDQSDPLAALGESGNCVAMSIDLAFLAGMAGIPLGFVDVLSTNADNGGHALLQYTPPDGNNGNGPTFFIDPKEGWIKPALPADYKGITYNLTWDVAGAWLLQWQAGNVFKEGTLDSLRHALALAEKVESLDKTVYATMRDLIEAIKEKIKEKETMPDPAPLPKIDPTVTMR